MYHTCDPLSKNQNYLHFPRILFYDFFVSRGKNQWTVIKVSAISGNGFGVVAIDNKKSKTIDLYSAYTEKMYRHSFNRS